MRATDGDPSCDLVDLACSGTQAPRSLGTTTSREALRQTTGVRDPNTGPAGDGGAIYTDGNTYTETLCGVEMTNYRSNVGGGGIIFYSGDGFNHPVAVLPTGAPRPSLRDADPVVRKLMGTETHSGHQFT